MDQAVDFVSSLFNFKFDIVGLLNLIKTADFMSIIMKILDSVVR